MEDWLSHWIISEKMGLIVLDSLINGLVVQLGIDIVDRRYGTGSLLPAEQDLAETYQVSRTSLKDALALLEQLCLLKVEQGAGNRVLEFGNVGGATLISTLVQLDGPGWLNEIFAVRRDIGMLIASEAAAHATREQVFQLESLVQVVRQAPDTDVAQLVDCELHRALADSTGNRVYRHLSNTLLDMYLPFRKLFDAPFTNVVAAAARWERLVSAVGEGDSGAAESAASKYMEETERLMLKGTTVGGHR